MTRPGFSPAERAAVDLIRRTAAKERALDRRMRETAGLAREKAAAVRAERAMRTAAVALREYVLARGMYTTFSDVVEGLDVVIAGRRPPPLWRSLAADATKRNRAIRRAIAAEEVEQHA